MMSCYRLVFPISLMALFLSVFGQKCEQLDGKILLEGCDTIRGASIISHGGTVVNDSNCDVLLPKLIFTKEPRVYFNKAKKDKYYTVVMIDPDAPNHVPGNFYLHMIKANIPGNSLEKGDLSQASVVKDYVAPTPTSGTGDHRYIFVIYEQTSENLELKSPKARANFEISKWMDGLPLCGPMVGVQFRSRYYL